MHGPSRHKNPSVGLYRFATAFPGHREHVALQRQSFASAWPCRHTPFNLEGFKTCAKHGPSRHKTPLWAFTALPLPSQVTANTLPCSGSPLPAPGHVAILHLEGCHCLPRSPQTRCPAAAALCQRLASRHTPFRGFQNVREARPITTQNPSVGLYRLTTAFRGHREHVALQRQPFASAWPVAILHLEGFKTCAKHGPSRHKTPLWAFTAYHCLPRSPRTGCPAAAVLCQRLASSPYSI